MLRIALIASLLVGCADLGAVEDDDCTTSLQVTPSGDPLVGTEVRVTANIYNPNGGVPNIEWRVTHEQLEVPITGDGTMEISFIPGAAGTYFVDMTPSSPGSSCPSQQTEINVVTGQPGGDVRLHVMPPPGIDVPPIDRLIVLPAGSPTYSMGTVTLDPGAITAGTVGMPAYLRFYPGGQPEAIVETYTNGSGAYSARVQLTPHQILIVPMDTAYPPQTVADNQLTGAESYTVSAGVAITGTVLRPNGTPLQGANVQIFQNDVAGLTVPSTIGTSAANGSFTLRAFTSNGTNARVVVTPPAGSGLPRLETSSQGFNFTNAITVSYGASLVTRNVSGTSVVRGGALANAKVTIVGTIPFSSAGTIVAGASAVANGFVRIPMTANASGVLPSVLVPAGDLYAVVEPANAPGDSAVVAFNTTASVPSTINAPAMVPFSTTVKHDSDIIGGARLELVPTGALGLAGVGPTVVYANEAGLLSGTFASGAIYRSYLSDPSRRAGTGGIDVATVPGTTYLPDALVITGTLQIQGQTNRIDGASVHVLCNSDSAFPCDGVERDRPLGEDASDSQGSFAVAVTRPGVPI